MRRFRNIFAVACVAVLFILCSSGQADAQRRNERDVRDALRSLNSKIDDFQFGLNYQLRSSSADRQDVDDVATSLRGLQEKIDAFEKN
ncbi:MAG: hypothetical protein ABI539_14975, partial [Acidobacteriota bacterium]